MNFKNYLAQSTLRGTVREWMTPGLAVEFIQPWYTPLTCTPSTTGIPLGGIGSAVTVTAAGTTPVLHCVPGVQVKSSEQASIALSQFFVRESVLGADKPLRIVNLGAFQRKIATYTLVDTDGQPLFASNATLEQAEKRLQSVCTQAWAWQANAERLSRWQIEWSPRTRALLDAAQTGSSEFQRAWIIDFFDGVVGEAANFQGSLTAAWDNCDHILGQSTYDASQMDFEALYPVAATSYRNGPAANIRKVQWSAVMPNEEKLASLPVSFTAFELQNPTDQSLEITLVQVQDNLCGYQTLKDRHGVQDASFVLQPTARWPLGESFTFSSADGRQVAGVEFSNKQPQPESDFDGRMSISATSSEAMITVKPMFYQDLSANLLEGALVSGRVNSSFVRNVYSGREPMAGMVCATVVLAPGAQAEVLFQMVLDFPSIRLPGLQSQKKYTTYFPQSQGRVQSMLALSLELDASIRKDIPLSFARLADAPGMNIIGAPQSNDRKAFVTLAINTLGFLAEATVWDNEDRFLVRECADYPFFDSLDVYFYGSFGLLALMQRLDGAVMRRFAEAVLAADTKERRHHEYVNHPYADLPDAKLQGPRAVRGAVIHDLGSPFDAQPDAYDWHNVKEWKDLAPKFVLMVWRHFKASGDASVLKDCAEAVYTCMDYLQNMLEPAQEFPLTHGTDDTFDNLSSHGISVYCGSLWIAGLRAAAAIAKQLGDTTRAKDWEQRAQTAQVQFEEALWDESQGYYRFFVTPVETKDIADGALVTLLPHLGTLGIQPKTPVLEDTVRAMNHWLNKSQTIAERRERKQGLLDTAPNCFNACYRAKLNLDNDDVFADGMLADTYLRLLGLEPVSPADRVSRHLDKVYTTNYKANSPLLGAANLVHKDGSPLDEYNFQAHDVWIGIQYSLATSMLLHNMDAQAMDVTRSMIRNLYVEARIPFAAPEGFNGSCRLHPGQALDARLHSDLVAAKALLPDHRISPELPRDLPAFRAKFESLCTKHSVDVVWLYRSLHSTALKYTAGRYLRPGMVWAIAQACAMRSQTK